MRISQALKLGHANVTAHKGRSLAIIITISVLFGLVMGMDFVLQGLQDSMLRYADAFSEGKIYLKSEYSGSRGMEIVRQRLEKYHGEVVGEITMMEMGGEPTVDVVSPAVVERFLTMSLEEVPEGKLPVVMSDEMLRRIAEVEARGDEYKMAVAKDDYVVVGTYEELGATALRLGGAREINLLDLVLNNMGGFSGYDMLVVDDGSGEVQTYVAERRQEIIERYERAAMEYGTWEEGEEFYVPDMEDKVALVAVFTDAEMAYQYTLLDDETEFDYRSSQYYTSELFGNQVRIIAATRRMQKMLSVLEIAILVVAVVVMAFTFAHLVTLEAPIIALYRSLGARTLDIVWIYLAYLLELCFYATVLATVVGAAIAGVVTWLNSAALQRLAERYYDLELPGKMILLGFNWKYVKIVGLMLLVAPVAFGLTVDQLSPRRIAQKLKED